MRASAVVRADELDFEALWGAEGKEGECEEGEDGDGIHGWIWVWAFFLGWLGMIRDGFVILFGYGAG